MEGKLEQTVFAGENIETIRILYEISGQMRKDIAAGTYNAYIVVKDDEGNLAKTEFTFIVKEKPIPSIS